MSREGKGKGKASYIQNQIGENDIVLVSDMTL